MGGGVILEVRKTCAYHMGDYNLYLLNLSSHTPTNEFIEINLEYSFMPLITKPTILMRSTSNLIDNIFGNSLHNINYFKGILLYLLYYYIIIIIIVFFLIIRNMNLGKNMQYGFIPV